MGSNYDPFSQNVTFHAADGTPFDVPLGAVDEMTQYAVRICVNYAAQLGASVVLLLILLLLTRPEKRASWVFALNCLALLLNFGRLLTAIIYFTTQFFRAYAYFSGDYSRVPTSAYANSVLAVVFSTLLLICIEISLVLQVQIVCANLRRVYQRILLGISIAVALVPITFRLWFMVENAKSIMSIESPVPIQWLESVSNIVLTVSICFFCAVFVTKLGFAIRLRRRLGLKDFGPMKVIFIMGCQTLIIPAFFSIIHYVIIVPELASNVLTLVTISLPLSSIWAGTTLDKSSSHISARRNLWQVLSFSNSNNTKQESTSTSSIPGHRKPGTTCYSEAPIASKEQQQFRDPEFGIAVEHNISVHSMTRDSYGNV